MPLWRHGLRQSYSMNQLISDIQIPAPFQVGPPYGTGAIRIWLRRALFTIGIAILLSLAACATQSTDSLQGKPLSGYVRMTQVQAAYLGSGNAGGGVLYYQGHKYPFSVGGLGVGGIGIDDDAEMASSFVEIGLFEVTDLHGRVDQAVVIRRAELAAG